MVVLNLPPKKNLKLSAVRLRRLSVMRRLLRSLCSRVAEFSRGDFLAAAGGEMRSD